MSKNKSELKLESAFYMEPEEIADYFKSKGLKTSYRWQEVYAEAHAKAFTVAKMTELDLLKDTQDLLEKSIREGTGYNEFKRDAKKLFEKKGWGGVQEVINPQTGETEKVELGTPRRIQTIYTNNINSAYAAGRYKEQLEEVDTAPYWQYMTLADGNVRPSHRAMHGKVFRADDPLWDAFYPPNGWNCRCFVRNLTKRMVENQGLKVENSTGKISTVKETVGDEIKEIPSYKFETAGEFRELKPDAGWETNIGAHSWGIDVAAWRKVEAMPEDIRYKFISKMAENPHRETVINNMIDGVVKNNLKPKRFENTYSWITPDIYKACTAEKINLTLPVMVLQDNRISHVIGDRNKLSAEEFKQLYSIVNNPDEVYLDFTKNEPGLIYIRFIPDTDECIKVCFKLAIKSKISKDIVNNFATAGKVKRWNLKDPKYKKIK